MSNNENSYLRIGNINYYINKKDYAKMGSFITDGVTIEEVIYFNTVTLQYRIKPKGRTPMCQHRDATKWDLAIPIKPIDNEQH